MDQWVPLLLRIRDLTNGAIASAGETDPDWVPDSVFHLAVRLLDAAQAVPGAPPLDLAGDHVVLAALVLASKLDVGKRFLRPAEIIPVARSTTTPRSIVDAEALLLQRLDFRFTEPQRHLPPPDVAADSMRRFLHDHVLASGNLRTTVAPELVGPAVDVLVELFRRFVRTRLDLSVANAEAFAEPVDADDEVWMVAARILHTPVQDYVARLYDSARHGHLLLPFQLFRHHEHPERPPPEELGPRPLPRDDGARHGVGVGDDWTVRVGPYHEEGADAVVRDGGARTAQEVDDLVLRCGAQGIVVP